MTSTQNSTNYINSNDEDKNILEEEFLNCKIGEFPTPKNLLKSLEELEIFKEHNKEEEKNEPKESEDLNEPKDSIESQVLKEFE